LAELTDKVRKKPSELSRAERDEFLDLYQRTSAHLSQLRASGATPALNVRLTGLLAEANSVLYSQRKGGWASFYLFFLESFPGALWHIRRFIAISAALLLVPAIITGIWVGLSEDAQRTIPPAVAETYVSEDFEAYYSSEPAAEFATAVFVNNIWVSFQAFAFGIAFCVGSAFVLIINGVFVGQAAGLFAAEGQLDKFFGLILPHGMLELTAIFIAGGTGLVLGWTIIAPGDRSRSDALVEEGRRAIVVVMGTVLVFFAAAIIEGFVTGAPLSTAVRVGIGFAAWFTFALYAYVLGRRAALAGKSGLWGESRPRWEDKPAVELSERATVSIAD